MKAYTCWHFIVVSAGRLGAIPLLHFFFVSESALVTDDQKDQVIGKFYFLKYIFLKIYFYRRVIKMKLKFKAIYLGQSKLVVNKNEKKIIIIIIIK